MKIILGGDYYVSNTNDIPLISGGIDSIFLNADSTILNYEGPIFTSDGLKNQKTGPNLSQNPDSISYLRDRGVTALSVANNHFYDYGFSALKSTLDHLEVNNISSLGYKEERKSKEFVIEKGNIKLAVLAYAEEEWCGSAGADISISLIDDIDILKDISRCKNEVDGVVIILHANNEYNSLPSPKLMKKCRFYIEEGACAVVVHHAHVISGFEIWENYPIFYGLGNFQFTMKSANPDWYEGLLLQLEFKKLSGGLEVDFSLYPTVVDQTSYDVSLAEGEQKYQIINQIHNNALLMSSEKSLDASYHQFLQSKEYMYYEMLNPFYEKNKLMRLIGRFIVKLILLDGVFKKMLLNVLRCYSHRNAMIEIMQRLIYMGK